VNGAPRGLRNDLRAPIVAQDLLRGSSGSLPMTDVGAWVLRVTALLIAILVVPACAFDTGDDDEETEPTAEDAEALKTGKVIVGIADSDPDTFDGAAWKDLGLDWARRVVPWNVALLPENCAIRTQFVDYVRKARATTTKIAIMFGPDAGGDIRACPTSKDRTRAPSLADYRAAMNAFVKAFPKQKTLAAWNEPDFSDGPRVADLNAPLRERPKRAADYYVELQSACPSCLVLAGEFASNPAAKEEYWQPYFSRLREKGMKPRVWSIHPTRDLLLYAAHAADPKDGKRCTRNEMGGCVTKTFATWVASLPGNAHVWLTETEAPVSYPGIAMLDKKFNGLSKERRENIQADAVRFLFDEIVKSHANVTRVFLYPLHEGGRQRDTSLVDGNNRRREAYGVVKRYAN
jgi:hypothetical protein